MKRKVIFLLALATSYAAQANAATNNEVAGQYIVTDCGTVYKIPTNATSDQAASLIDLYSKIDLFDPQDRLCFLHGSGRLVEV